jgi:3-oxoacyl-(acyl-carrier-protein) synthase
MQQLFEKIPPYSSTKAFTGHTLGAAGAVEAIYSILSIVNGELFPNLNVQEPIAPKDQTPVFQWADNHQVNYVLSNSFGLEETVLHWFSAVSTNFPASAREESSGRPQQ